MKFIVLHNQTLLDLSVQHYGSAECAFDLALANDLPLDVELAAGQELKPVRTFIYAQPNRQIADYYANKGLKPATAISDELLAGIFDATFDNSFE